MFFLCFLLCVFFPWYYFKGFFRLEDSSSGNVSVLTNELYKLLSWMFVNIDLYSLNSLQFVLISPIFVENSFGCNSFVGDSSHSAIRKQLKPVKYSSKNLFIVVIKLLNCDSEKNWNMLQIQVYKSLYMIILWNNIFHVTTEIYCRRNLKTVIVSFLNSKFWYDRYICKGNNDPPISFTNIC